MDGRRRDLITVVPAPYDAHKPHDLVVAFHGMTNSNADARSYFDLEDHAPRPAVFVYPSGLPAGEGRRSWSDPADSAAELRDYALFDAIVARLEREYCIDRRRVFAVGHSLGAWFVNSLGCARGKVLRGIGTVAGGISASECTGPVAAVVVHNPNDRLVDFARGEEVRDLLLRRNGLAEDSSQPEAGAEHLTEHLNCVRYGGPDHRHPVLWCPHARDWTRRGRYYPHQWPQETGAIIMTFFGALPATSARPE
ncbi:MAG: alpha/beta hydrolase family esterase [Rhodoplanes sp.]